MIREYDWWINDQEGKIYRVPSPYPTNFRPQEDERILSYMDINCVMDKIFELEQKIARLELAAIGNPTNT